VDLQRLWLDKHRRIEWVKEDLADVIAEWTSSLPQPADRPAPFADEEDPEGTEETQFSHLEQIAETSPEQAIYYAWGLLEYQLNVASERLAPAQLFGWPHVARSLEAWENWPLLSPVIMELRRLRDNTVESSRPPTRSDAAIYLSVARDVVTMLRTSLLRSSSGDLADTWLTDDKLAALRAFGNAQPSRRGLWSRLRRLPQRRASLQFPQRAARFTALSPIAEVISAATNAEDSPNDPAITRRETGFGILEVLADTAPEQAIIDAWALLEYQLNATSDRLAPDQPHGWPQVALGLRALEKWPLLFPAIAELRRLRDYTVESDWPPSPSDAARYVAVARELAATLQASC
jgi:hypothetical protein